MTVRKQKGSRRLLVALMVVLSLSAFASVTPGLAGATVTPAEPAFKLSSILSPTRILTEDETGLQTYTVHIINSGAAPTNGKTPIVITDELPPGVISDPTPNGFTGPAHAFGDHSEFFPCVGESVVVCEVLPSELYTQGRVPPGGTLSVLIPVDVGTEAEVPNPAVNRVSVSGGGVAEASYEESSPLGTHEQAPFGFTSITSRAEDSDGAPYTEAGGHPYSYTAHFQFNQDFYPELEGAYPVRNTRIAVAKLPKGLVVNPRATKTLCTEAQFEASVETECPAESAIGLAYPALNVFGFANSTLDGPLYNLVPPPGAAAAFGFAPGGFSLFVHIIGSVDAEGDYVLTASAKDITTYASISGLDIELWGQPTDPSHVQRRGNCAYQGGFGFHEQGCPAEFQDSPLLTMPTACSGPEPELSVEMTPWQEPQDKISASTPDTDAEGNPEPVNGCNRLEFKPSISSQPTTNVADSPTGLEFNLHQEQHGGFEGLATASLRDAKVTLPPGVTLDPSAANGLASCSESQIGYQPTGGKIHFSAAAQSCPNAAKVGSVEINTPLLDHKLPGAIYVAKPYQNPFGSLLAIYLAIEDEQSGIVAKLAGKVEPNPVTGQLTATFTENPELPIEDISLHFFNGPRAALKTPLTCGSYTTTSDLTPWSTPEGADATPSNTFGTSVAASGSGACPTSEANAPAAASFTAGTLAPHAGAFSPFLLKLVRADGSQHITGIDTTLPQGLLGKLAGIPYCPEADIAVARSREVTEKGKEELSSPACPAASEVGTVTVGAGAGISPYYVSGHAYLAGPYKGAPLSLVTIVPAVAGPFDLGNVVTRIALNVNEYSAQIHAVSDPLPTILDGIPLDLRSIALRLDRPGFILNPTNCDATQITGTATTQAGQSVALKNSFQVGECKRLAFKPKLSLSLKGATKRTGHPALKAVVKLPKGNAGIARAQVGLPHSEFLDQGNLDNVCSQANLKAASCPAKSIYGKVKAYTPLLSKPLEGNVYLAVGFGYKLPALVAELNGQIRVLLKGKVDTDKNHGIRTTFEAVPDAPVEKFVLELKGGPKYGLLENSENLCKKTQKAEAAFSAQSGKLLSLTPTIANSCKGGGTKGKGGKKGKGKKGHKRGSGGKK